MLTNKEELRCRYFKLHCNYEGNQWGFCSLKSKLVNFNECKCPVVIL